MSAVDAGAPGLRLVVRRTIRATTERLFEAWTTPAQLREWWGPADVVCTSADVDLRIGGRFRLANRFASGAIVWIAGEYEVIDPPRQLVYTWFVEPDAGVRERVTVRFESRARATEVIIVHELIAGPRERDSHEHGWVACLDGLETYLSHR